MSDIRDRLVDRSRTTAEPLSSLLLEAAHEIARLRLTDAEREALERTWDTLRCLQADYGKTQTEQDAATLRGLLERMK